VIRIDLPATVVPAGRTVRTTDSTRAAAPPATARARAASGLRLRSGARIHLEARGPERIALLGANGSGKTTLLRTLLGELVPVEGAVRVAVPVRYLPQRLDVLDDDLTVVENVRAVAPSATDQAIRARLRFLLRGADADRPAGTLSGGERFRATLAALLLAEPAPQLLLLDEPTNSLDLPASTA
jgi:ATPase subunit of ABC transporter with duplicated ATPase domains